MDLLGKRILITGAARGLGRELAAHLADEGARLILVDREPVTQANAETHLCDLSDPTRREKLIADLQTSRPDILVNCAGIGSHSKLNQLTAGEVGRVMQVNALAPLELIAELSPLELIVNIGSVAGEMSLPSMGLYGASKSAVHTFTRSIQLEGVKTLLVILGPLRGTDFAQSIAHPHTGQPGWYRRLDLPVETAASLIVKAMKRGKSQLVAPGWYRLVFPLARMFAPLVAWYGKIFS